MNSAISGKEGPGGERHAVAWRALAASCRDGLSTALGSRRCDSPCRRPIQHALDPAAHPARRLRLGLPDGLDRLHHQANVDRRDGQAAEHRESVGGERVAPLLPVLGVAPAGLMRGDKGFGALLERHRLGRLDDRGHAGSFSRFDRINPIETLTTAFARSLALPRARYPDRAKPHVVRLPVEHVAEYPCLAAARAHPQAKPAAIRV